MIGKMLGYVVALMLVQTVAGQSQPTHELPFNSENNMIEFSVANELGHEIESAQLRSDSIPSWMKISPEFETIAMLSAGDEQIFRFHFSVLKTAPVHMQAPVKFVVTTPSGDQWKKEILVSVSPPENSTLFQNFPNPFNPSTSISYQLRENAHVQINIYDVLGRVVTSLADNQELAGYHELRWNASGVAGSVYMLHISAHGSDGRLIYDAARKMVMLR